MKHFFPFFKTLALAGTVWAATVAPVAAEIDPSYVLTQPAAGSLPGGEYDSEVQCLEVHRSVRVLNPDLVLGEPLIVEIKMKGDPIIKKVEARADTISNFQIGQDIDVWIYPSSGQPFQYDQGRKTAVNPNLLIQLAKDEVFETRLLFAYDYNSLTGAFFDQPGNFKLLIRMVCKNPRSVESDDFQRIGFLDINVRKPEPRSDDAKALKIMESDPDLFQSIQLMSLVNPSHEKAIRAIIEQAPQSKLHPYALMTLANESFFVAKTNNDPAKFEEAIKLYDQFVALYPDHYAAPYALTRKIQSLRVLNREDEARQVFSEIWTHPQYSRVLRPSDELNLWMFGPYEEPNEAEWMIFNQPADAMFVHKL